MFKQTHVLHVVILSPHEPHHVHVLIVFLLIRGHLHHAHESLFVQCATERVRGQNAVE